MSDSSEYLFKCITTDGYILKIINELSQFIKNGGIHFGKDGISIEGGDNIKLQKSSRMISIFLPKERFTKYKIVDELTIHLNFLHLYALTKNIRKKDIAVLCVYKENPSKLIIRKMAAGDNERTSLENSINFNLTQKNHLIPPDVDVYEHPIVVSSKDFQKIKNLKKMGKITKVSFKNGKINFTTDKVIFSSKVTFGNNIDDDDCEDSTDGEEDEEECLQTYYSDYIIDLVKLASTSKNIQIYAREDFPLKFTIEHPLGKADVYIKSNEIIEEEMNDETNNQ